MLTAVRLGDICPIPGCLAQVKERDGIALVCVRGHRLVDKDGPRVHGQQQIRPGQVERG